MFSVLLYRSLSSIFLQFKVALILFEHLNFKYPVKDFQMFNGAVTNNRISCLSSTFHGTKEQASRITWKVSNFIFSCGSSVYLNVSVDFDS